MLKDPKELEVRAIFKARSDAAVEKLKDVPASMAADKAAAVKKVDDLKAANGPVADIQAAEKALAGLPVDEAAAKAAYTAARTSNAAKSAPPIRHAQPFPGKDEAAQDISRKNFMALVFCLMIGTAALPHILMRYYTVPSVREARESVSWSLFFIFLLYFTAPALAVLAKFEVYTVLVGTPFASLPEWIARWSAVDAFCNWLSSRLVATSSCWPRQKLVACPMWYRAWLLLVAWLRLCPLLMACC